MADQRVILVPLDDSWVAKAILPYAEMLAQTLKDGIRLLSVAGERSDVAFDEAMKERAMDGNVVLVPLDGSQFSEAALGYAETVARANKCGIRLLRVIETEFEGLLSQHLHLGAKIEQAGIDTAARYLAQVSRRLDERGLQAESDTGIGSPAHEILVAAERSDVVIVVMATHGRGGAERWAIGSVADKVLRTGAKPTLLVRPRTSSPSAGAVELHRMLVPLDGSALANAALEPASELARATGAALVLLRVIPDLDVALDWGNSYLPELGGLEGEMADSAREALQVIRAQMSGGVQAEVVVLQGPAALVIEDYLKSHAIDLTVMTTHGRGGLARLVLGNTAGRLVQSGASVLIIHPQASAGEVTAGR